MKIANVSISLQLLALLLLVLLSTTISYQICQPHPAYPGNRHPTVSLAILAAAAKNGQGMEDAVAEENEENVERRIRAGHSFFVTCLAA
ncbi:hypothetical protein ACLKA6_000871 [Drosophila palustris]